MSAGNCENSCFASGRLADSLHVDDEGTGVGIERFAERVRNRGTDRRDGDWDGDRCGDSPAEVVQLIMRDGEGVGAHGSRMSSGCASADEFTCSSKSQ